MPIAQLLRVFLLASVAIGACVWALVRYYTKPRQPMVVPREDIHWIDLDGGVFDLPLAEEPRDR